MPKVSIILPTFNRRDTVMRAIRSARAQTFQDWELIAVDDGSTDDTATLIAGADPRLIVIRQANAGMTEARNTGIRAAKGEYIAFLDSDDEFLPHHLELCVAFLDAFKEEKFVSTELLEDFGHGRVVNHYRIETSTWYPEKAALIGTHGIDLPSGETDDYLRVYGSREAIGEWGRAIVEGIDKKWDGAFLYRGMIFDYMRYDFLIAITASVIRASVFETLGLPEAGWRNGSDFHYLARICKTWRANFISVPTFVKHEFAEDGTIPSHGHIVTGSSGLAFAKDWQRAWDDLFWNAGQHDPEVRGLRSLRQFWMAELALKLGQREVALAELHQVKDQLPQFWRAVVLYWLVRCLPGAAAPRGAYGWIDRIARASDRYF